MIVGRDAPTLLKTFAAHCLHQATLWQVREIGLQEAVDELRFKAVRHGLLRDYGAAEIEWIIGTAFGQVAVHYSNIRVREETWP
ncbi:MAG TPA: hypothetical protein VGJ20_20620 [Xanthobacteraceae bacterium]|jgi:hypothetical protein